MNNKQHVRITDKDQDSKMSERLSMPAKLLTTKNQSKPKWRIWLENIVLFLVVYFGIHIYQTWSLEKATSPNIAGTLLDGSVFELGDVEYPVLVHFWATWCKVCRFEHGSIDAIAEDYTTVTIASQSGDVSTVRTYVQQQDITAPVLVDHTHQWAKQYGIRGYPTSFIIDENKQIRFVVVGYTSELGLRARLWLAKF